MIIANPANLYYLVDPQLTFDKKDILDELFKDSGLGAIELVGDPMPGDTIASHWEAAVSNTDGRIYMSPCSGVQTLRFDPATETWEQFGDIPEICVLIK